MNIFQELLKNSTRKVIGVLSGTSVDAVDIVLTEISGYGINTNLNIVNFESFPIPQDLKSYILQCSAGGECKVEDICRLNYLLGYFISDSIKSFLENNNLEAKDVDLVGSHGQTICHIPNSEDLYGYSVKSSLQVGDPAVIANLTGITTAGDFRTADIAVNGGGAPLVPFLDYIMFKEGKSNKVLLNIGGISNITLLEENSSLENLKAFDTGPGNMMIDSLAKKFFNKNFDEDGNIAASGRVDENLFRKICGYDVYFKAAPPKSTGREYYGKTFIDFIISEAGGISGEDILRTVTEFTVHTIIYNIRKFSEVRLDHINELIVSGGGANNKFIIKRLQEELPGSEVKRLNRVGINTENKEAVLFAVLANELVSGQKANVPSVTGAEKNVFMGKICLA